jgi:electron transfer flavoprotein alpha subunit
VKIVCLVKQVPRADAIEFDPETKALKREGVPLLLNEFDRYAVAEAARLGGEVVAMTMGPPSAEEALRLTLALGADRCVHLSDRVFAVADTIGTSRTLAMAIRKEGADLVLCGRKTTDSETWQVPPEVAAYLGWLHVTSVVALEAADGRLRAVRETDEGEEVYELEPPAVCSIARPPQQVAELEPVPDAEGRIAVWTAADLVSDLQPNDKRFGQTGSPTRVLAVRDVTPERAGTAAGDAREAADLIASLLTERRAGETAWEKPERLGEQPGRSYDCWTAVEVREGEPTRHSLELLAKGRELSGKLGGRNVALLLGHGLNGASVTAARYGAEVVCLVDDPALAEYHPERHAAALRQVIEREQPHVLLVPATANGRDAGPRAAGELELGMTGDCVDLGIDRAGRLIQHKPAYGGNIVSVIMGATTPQLATVRARMFELLEPRDGVEPEVRRLDVGGLPEPRARLAERREADPPPRRLDAADVVVCVGAEVGAREAAGELERTVTPLDAAVGGDHAACTAGLVPWSRQIGLLGRPVAPRLYLAVGASGDFEHLTGSVKAGVIAAVNAAPDAPMLAAADVALAGDWRQLVPPLVDALAGRI